MQKKKTAAYCRVSTTSDTQDRSFEVQCEYYEDLIASVKHFFTSWGWKIILPRTV